MEDSKKDVNSSIEEEAKILREMYDKHKAHFAGIKINNNDAFKIMEYRCDKCNASEFIWNSRNNVSPFTVRCRICDGSASHVNWSRDQFRPDFKPSKGMRYFADFTIERAHEVAEQFIKLLEERYPDEFTDSSVREERRLAIVSDMMQGGCQMDLIEVK